MIKKFIVKRKHKKALWLFRYCYESLDYLRQADWYLVRTNLRARHNSYNAVINLIWGDRDRTPLKGMLTDSEPVRKGGRNPRPSQPQPPPSAP